MTWDFSSFCDDKIVAIKETEAHPQTPGGSIPCDQWFILLPLQKMMHDLQGILEWDESQLMTFKGLQSKNKIKMNLH